MKIIKNKVLLIMTFISMIFPGCMIFADGFNLASAKDSFFHVAKYDTSMRLLGQIFGNVNNVLNTGNTSIFGVMFREFNKAMLVLVVLIILYTLVVGILNTAHQGEFLGKKYNSMWVPIRTAAGLALIVPTVCGYSVIQAFIMWVVVQGVGAADSLWKTVVVYLSNEGSVVAPVTTIGGAGVNTAADIFAKALIVQRKAVKDHILPPKPDCRLNSDDKGGICKFNSDYKVEWSNSESGDVMNALNNNMPLIVNELNDIAASYVARAPNGANDEDRVKANVELFKDNNPLAAAAVDMNKAIDAAINNKKNMEKGDGDVTNESGDKEVFTKAISYGWANAGAYYNIIANKNNANQKTSEIGRYVKNNNIKESGKFTDPNDETFIKNLITDAKGQDQVAPDNLTSNETSNPLVKSLNIAFVPVEAVFAVLLGGPGVVAAAGVSGASVVTMEFFKDASVNPIVKIQSLGNILFLALVGAYAVILAVSAAMAGIAGICDAVSPGQVIYLAFLKGMLTPILLLMGALAVVSLVMSVYVPMIPYIIFGFGVIGWMIAVVESMIAAPIVVLGLTHPEGQHDIYGRAEPAVQLILNLFLRPSLMIFGMVGGMVISYVAINFINAMFFQISGMNETITYFNPVKLLAYLTIYVSLVIAILNRCFSLIHLIPDQVLRWISNQHGFGEYAKGEEHVKAGFDKGAQVAGQGFEQTSRGIQSGIDGFMNKPIKKPGKIGGGKAGLPSPENPAEN